MSVDKPTAAEMVEKLEPLLTDALDKGRWADSEGLQNQLEGYREQAAKDVLKATIAKLKTELGEALVENLSLLAQIVSLKTAGAEVPSYVRVPKDGDPS